MGLVTLAKTNVPFHLASGYQRCLRTHELFVYLLTDLTNMSVIEEHHT